MKNQFTKIVAGIVLLTSGFMAQASKTEREIYIKREASKSVVLQMKNVTEGTKVSIWNRSGDLLFSDRVTGESYSKVFDLKHLQKGELLLEVENESSLEVLPIEVTEESATLKRNEEKVYVKPVVRLTHNELKVFLGENKNGFEMKMTDQFNDLVYKHHLDGSEGGMKRYDVSKLSSGKYNIQFTADGRSFYHTIIIK
ncbi:MULTISPECIES: hypothetical protein [Roseivirga]|uniref:Secretion system C-terminal sorting domain-containing protein n=1 Tax=Roseivirga thermotolerans TaxID=1758176 RepID=A0ABQ3I9A6_9BACT|nr:MULTISPECIES: hypothetical protein [Roseivirga]MEC7755938.1 hypothetical protein [Bacteroidota bacterium]GHE69653.1 hypothetical protein GCM10011340_27150 [Roseivirga thermotolerans]|tara:strand:- start:7948 stop:8541 length:594 start_codon:yes stop_codon:yes gene_type:complete